MPRATPPSIQPSRRDPAYTEGMTFPRAWLAAVFILCSGMVCLSVAMIDAGAEDSVVAEPAEASTRAKPRPPPLAIDMDVDPAAVIPPAVTHHMGREIAQTMHFTGAPWLVRESRQREEDCRLLLEALDIKKGQRICDLGCGNGFYTLELARRVGPEGVVYAVDIQPEMLRMLARLAAEEGLTNIRPILGTFVDPRLPKGEVDVVLCVDVYHEFSHPEQMLARMRESLAAGGQIVLAEFRAEDPAVPIKPLHKMSKAQIRSELEPAGFRVAREFDRLPWQHLVFLEAKPGR